jgi:hypothetical protein
VPVRLVGANPGLLLYAADGPDPRVGFASVWRVDWSVRGAGTALVLWHAGRTRVVTASPELGGWLAAEFTRHFPEVRGLPWPEPEITVAPVRLASDLARGVRAEAADVVVEIADPMDRRLVTVAAFDLGGTPNALSTVLMPCRRGTLQIAGRPVPGAPRVTTGPPASSTAFLADAEVWSDPPRQPGSA